MRSQNFDDRAARYDHRQIATYIQHRQNQQHDGYDKRCPIFYLKFAPQMQSPDIPAKQPNVNAAIKKPTANDSWQPFRKASNVRGTVPSARIVPFAHKVNRCEVFMVGILLAHKQRQVRDYDERTNNNGPSSIPASSRSSSLVCSIKSKSIVAKVPPIPSMLKKSLRGSSGASSCVVKVSASSS